MPEPASSSGTQVLEDLSERDSVRARLGDVVGYAVRLAEWSGTGYTLAISRESAPFESGSN